MKRKKGRNIILRVGLILTLLIFLGGLSALAAGEQESIGYLKKRIAVAGFENKVRPWWSGHWEIGEGMSEMLVTALVNTGKFIVLERQALEDILKEQKLAEEGKVTAQTAAQAGKLLGAQVLVRGAITEFSHKKSGGGAGIKIGGVKLGGSKSSAHVAVDVRIYDTTTGEVLTSKNVEGSAETTALSVGITGQDVSFGAAGFQKTPLGKATRQVIDRAVTLIVENMKNVPWEGAVVMVKGDNIYINVGSNVNVQGGEIFTVYEQGEELIDPQTGMSLGSEEEKLGRIEVVTVKDKYSIAKGLEGSGFSSGNILREK